MLYPLGRMMWDWNPEKIGGITPFLPKPEIWFRSPTDPSSLSVNQTPQYVDCQVVSESLGKVKDKFASASPEKGEIIIAEVR